MEREQPNQTPSASIEAFETKKIAESDELELHRDQKEPDYYALVLKEHESKTTMAWLTTSQLDELFSEVVEDAE